ncbi:hypothetical protein EV702DRAFT_1051216 [Suillus placidus]|uniref:Uncharacterized protein n=1 Tax=Suillus placidus TaxID=48579 RepID=A0A9P6ZGE1_9AGAM|nr:hypothetical protein EV702DRAFT_1051216 [Suillus placidus]
MPRKAAARWRGSSNSNALIMGVQLAGPLRTAVNALVAAVNRLDKSLSPLDTVTKLRAHKFTLKDSIYVLHILSALFWLTLMQVPPFPYKLAISILYALALLIPFTSQFFVPATPVFSWVLRQTRSNLPPSSAYAGQWHGGF